MDMGDICSLLVKKYLLKNEKNRNEKMCQSILLTNTKNVMSYNCIFNISKHVNFLIKYKKMCSSVTM